MRRKRIEFADWLPTIRREAPHEATNDDARSTECGIEGADSEVAQVVRQALASLTECERAVIEGYHFMGQAPSDIAKDLSLTPKRVDSALRTGEEKLRAVLQTYASQRWGVALQSGRRCPICESPARASADEIILGKPASATWRPIIARLRSELGVIVATPQTLIGHRTYHMLARVSQNDALRDDTPQPDAE